MESNAESTGIDATPSPLHFGIDLGTSNSSIAVYANGTARTLLVDGHETMPSVVSVDKDGNFAVGRVAANRALAFPDRVAASVKRRMGETDPVITLGEESFSPTQIAGRILGQLADAVYASEGEAIGGRPYHVVICVPANFMQDQKDETRRAAALAGLNCVGLLEEPIAAAIAYAMKGKTDQTIMVYDFGGGTLDVSILEATSDGLGGVSLAVKGTAGDPNLGGDDFDNRIIEHVLRKLADGGGPALSLDGTHPEISKATVRAALQVIKSAAVQAKHQLTTLDEYEIDIPELIKDHEGNSHSIEALVVTRSEFEDLVRDLVDRSFPAIEGALKEAGLDRDQIDKVVLAGGTTRIPLVRSSLTAFLGKEPWADQSVDTAIARGAAIECDARFQPVPIPIRNIVTHYLGIELASGAFDQLVEKGVAIPDEGIVVTKTYRNESDSIDSIIIRLYETDYPVSKVRLSQDVVQDIVAAHGKEPTVRCIGEFSVPIDPGPKGTVQVEVVMTINSQNVLSVKGSSTKGDDGFELDRRGVR